MDEKKKQTEDAQPDAAPQEESTAFTLSDDYVENLLSDMAENASALASVVSETMTEAPQPAPEESAEAEPEAQAQAEIVGQNETPEVIDVEATPVEEEAPSDAPEQAETEEPADTEPKAEEAPEPGAAPAEDTSAAENTPVDDAEEDEQELPPLHENMPVAVAAPDPTEGMSFKEKLEYHARMRRREQTHLRRENARRGNTNGDAYQPMSMMDIRFTVVRLAVAMLFVLIAFGLKHVLTPVAVIFYVIAYLLTVLPVAANVARNFTHGKYFDEYLLILVASFGAFLLGLRGEASLVLILHGVGRIISDLVLSNTHKSFSQQTDFVPDKASVVNMQGEERHVAPSEVKPGDFILVRSGERIPIDGIVLRGDGSVDDAVLTGDNETVPIVKGAKVLAGSSYTGSLLLLRAAARFEDCAVSQILRVQEEGTTRKAALEKNVVQGASRIIPVIVVLAVLLSVLPPLFNSGTSIRNWIYRALTVLVVCCPTALAISVPLSFTGGVGRLSQKGIHVKGSEAIEKMAELRMAVFDKTGTLTEGNLRVKEIQATSDFNQESCLALAAAAEQLSQHPVARAVVAAYQGVPQKIGEFEEFPGRGVRARIGNRNLLVGNRRLMISRGVKGVPDIRGTVVYVAYEGDYAGAIVLEDTIRPEAEQAIKDLKSQGVLRTVILTGDTELPTQQTADAVGIDTVHYGLMPEEKASKMEFLMRTIPTDGTAAYIGDGVNDIEELKMADVGVAMGVAGTQESADAANVLIMDHNLLRLSDTLRVCKRTHGIVMQNMLLVLAIKVILALLAVFGVVGMWQAISADVLLTVLTVFNSARILGTK